MSDAGRQHQAAPVRASILGTRFVSSLGFIRAGRGDRACGLDLDLVYSPSCNLRAPVDLDQGGCHAKVQEMEARPRPRPG